MNEYNKRQSAEAEPRRKLFKKLRMAKLSYNEIGKMQKPPITGERVRQIIHRVKK